MLSPSGVRLNLSSFEPDDSGGKVDRHQEFSGGFIVARRNCSELFDRTREILDEMAFPIGFAVEFEEVRRFGLDGIGTAGFFDVAEWLKELSAKGDSLERLNRVIDFGIVPGGSGAGRAARRTAAKGAGRRSIMC